jgi:L-iditol 2-dehydrogenase
MKAAIYSDVESIGIREVDYLPPAADHVIINTKCTGVCGSDLHNYFGHWKPRYEKYAEGHEVAGIISEIGEGVTDFEIGDHVTLECFTHCGKCTYCGEGHYNHCEQRGWFCKESHGGFAEFTSVHKSSIFKLPGSLSFEHGALIEPLAVSHRAVAQSGVGPADSLAIIGGGTIGQFCLAVAKAVGIADVTITTKYDHQAELAVSLGADHVVDVREGGLRQFAQQTHSPGMDAVIETVGSSSGFDDALASIRQRGTVVLVGGYHKPLEVNLGPIVGKEPILTGSNCYGYSGLKTDFDAALELIVSGKVDASKLVTHRFPLEAITEAFEIAADKHSGSVKVQVVQET